MRVPRVHLPQVLSLAALLCGVSCGSPGGGASRQPLTYVPPRTPAVGLKSPVQAQPQPVRPPSPPIATPPSALPRTNPPAVAVPAPPKTLTPSTTVPVPQPPVFTPVPPDPKARPATQPSNGSWLSFESWAVANGLGRPQRHATSTNVFHLRTGAGTVVLTAGSQLATLGGMKFYLGFAPQLARGQLQIHTLDAQKNLMPLLSTHALPPRGNRVVVIDPGHGGDNTGAKSVHNGRLEKEYALDWARRLKPLLEQRGWKVHLTRNSDTPLGLSERVALASNLNPSLFISLHFNASGSSQSGLETYCLTPAGMPSNLTRDFKDDPLDVQPGNAWDRQNLQYAARLHRSLIQNAGLTDRGVRHARFMTVLRGQRSPAVLIEGGYLTNPAEARLIADPAHRQKLALAVARALE